jgi:outer membrane receptor protein involved in Fe transport
VNRAIPIGALLLVWSSILLAQDGPLIEEVIVTAQRVEENAQKVPVAVSAFDDAMLDDRQIILLSDLQINAPNVHFSTLRFGDWDMRIRGIGQSGTLGGAGRTISTHINEVGLDQSFAALEFYDMERVELMRGPQITLFGNNATAGALNQVTKRPDFDGVGGYLDVEFGDYDHRRLKGAINLPVGEKLAFRIAAMDLKRNGYSENKADGQVPGVDGDVDGRNITAFRITGEWRITDRINLWVLHDRFDEDDDRTIYTNIVCKQSPLPVTGCEPDEFGLDIPHPGSMWWSIMAALGGAIPLGAVGNDDGLNYDFPRPELGLRDVHTDLEPGPDGQRGPP